MPQIIPRHFIGLVMDDDDSRRVRFSGQDQFSSPPQAAESVSAANGSMFQKDHTLAHDEHAPELLAGTQVCIHDDHNDVSTDAEVDGVEPSGRYALKLLADGAPSSGHDLRNLLILADAESVADGLQQGDPVQFRAASPSPWQSGHITAVKGSRRHTFDVQLTKSGQLHRDVTPAHLRLALPPTEVFGEASMAAYALQVDAGKPPPTAGNAPIFAPGTRAERWSQRKRTWMPGTVTNVQLVGGVATFQFRSDAGKVRSNVPAAALRTPGGVHAPDTGDGYGKDHNTADIVFEVACGTRCVARVHGAGDEQGATVTALGSGGTVTLLYDSGETESDVPRSALKLPGMGADQSGHGNAAVRVGDTVVLPPRTGSAATQGRVTRVHSAQSAYAGTVDVLFKNGATGRALDLSAAIDVKAGDWVPADGGSPAKQAGEAATASSAFQWVVGDRTEAQFQGRGDVIGATVTDVEAGPEGRITLQFDSGEVEAAVPRGEVTPAAAGSTSLGVREGDHVLAASKPDSSAMAAAIVTRVRRNAQVDLSFVRSGLKRGGVPISSLGGVRVAKPLLPGTDAALRCLLPGAGVVVQYRGRLTAAEVVAVDAVSREVDLTVKRKRRVYPAADVEIDWDNKQPVDVQRAVEVEECPFPSAIAGAGTSTGDDGADSDASFGAGADDDSDASYDGVYGRSGSHPDTAAPDKGILASTLSMMLGVAAGGGTVHMRAQAHGGGAGDVMTPLKGGGASMLAPSVLQHLASTRVGGVSAAGVPPPADGHNDATASGQVPPHTNTKQLVHYEPPATALSGNVRYAQDYKHWQPQHAGALAGGKGSGGGFTSWAPLGRYVDRTTRTRLSRYGFADALLADADVPAGVGSSRTLSGGAQGVVTDMAVTPALEAPVDLDVELSDALDAHDIEIQFAMMSLFPNAQHSPSNVFFTFSFWTAGGIRTQPLRCVEDAAVKQSEGGHVFVLTLQHTAGAPGNFDRRPTTRDRSRYGYGDDNDAAGGDDHTAEGKTATCGEVAGGGKVASEGNSSSKTAPEDEPQYDRASAWSGDVRRSVQSLRQGSVVSDGGLLLDARLSSGTSNVPVVAVRVDPGLAGAAGGVKAFLEYLAEKSLHLEVWDGDSQLPLAHCMVPLAPLLRRQRRSRVVARTLAMLPYMRAVQDGQTGLSGECTSAAAAALVRLPEVHTGHAADMRGGGGMAAGMWSMDPTLAPIGELTLLLKNTGRRGTAPTDVSHNEPAPGSGQLAIGSRPAVTPIVTTSTGVAALTHSQKRAARVRVAARPLGAASGGGGTGDAGLLALLAARGAGRSSAASGRVSVAAARRGGAEGGSHRDAVQSGTAAGSISAEDTVGHAGGIGEVDAMSAPDMLSQTETAILQRILSSGDAAVGSPPGSVGPTYGACFLSTDMVHFLTGDVGTLLGDTRGAAQVKTAEAGHKALSMGGTSPTLEILVARSVLAEAQRAAVVAGLPEGPDAPEACLTQDPGQRGELLFAPFVAAESYVSQKLAAGRRSQALGQRHARRGDSAAEEEALAAAVDPAMESVALTAGEEHLVLDAGEMILGRMRWVLARDLKLRVTDGEWDGLVDAWEVAQRRRGKAGPIRRAAGVAGDKRELLVVPWRGFLNWVLDAALRLAREARQAGGEGDAADQSQATQVGESGTIAGHWVIVVQRDMGGHLPPAAVVARGKLLRALSYVGRSGVQGPASFLRSMLSAVDFSRRGSITWGDFSTACAEFLGMTVVLPGAASSGQGGDGRLPGSDMAVRIAATAGAASKESSVLVNSEYGAALAARMLRRSIAAENDTSVVAGPRGVMTQTGSSSGGGARGEKLRLLQLYREGRKSAVVGSMLRAAVTSVYYLHASFGVASLLLHTLVNPYPSPMRLKVDIMDPLGELRLVTDHAEAAFLCRVLGATAPDQGAAMLSATSGEHVMSGVPGSSTGGALCTPEGDVVLGPRECITLPFVFRSFAGGGVPPTREALLNNRRDSATDPLVAQEAQGAFEQNQEGTAPGSRSLVPADAHRHSTAYTALALTTGEIRRMRKQEEWARDTERGAHAAGHVRSGWQTSLKARTIPVRVSAADSGAELALLKVVLRPRPFPTHRVLRFFVPEGEYMAADIILPSKPAGGHASAGSGATSSSRALAATAAGQAGAAVPGQYVHVSDAEATVEVRETTEGRVATLRYRAGAWPAAHDLHLLLYNDPFGASLHECWHIMVHPLAHHSVSTTVGSTARIEIGLQGGRRQREARVHVSHPQLLSVLGGDRLELLPGATNTLRMTHKATQAGTCNMQVHVTDAHTGELLSAWRVSATAAMPHISRAYTIQVPAGRGVMRKLEYTNRWPNSRVFNFKTNAPSIVAVREPASLTLTGGEMGYLPLGIGAVRTARHEEVLLFVNDEDDVNVETCLIRVKYVPSAYVR